MKEEYFDIHFDDLTADCQKKLLEFFGVKSEKDMNWDVIPITSLPKPEEEDGVAA